MKIVILERGSVGADVSVEELSRFGEVESYENSLPETIAERVADADIIIANKMPINEKTIGAASKVKLICQFATGYDNIDIAYCKERNIAVANVSDYCTAAVVQHTFALTFYLLEHLRFYDDYVKDGNYTNQNRFSYFDKVYTELSGKTWGIIGMGNIGRSVAQAAKAFGCDVKWYSTSGAKREEDWPQADFETILKESDVLSLHCPLNDRTRFLIDKEALQKMKKTAILINVARGAVVNNADLAEALQSGTIAAAGLDVVEQEPIAPDNPLMKIKDSDRLIITPHMAWASVEARRRVVEEAGKNIEAFIQGEKRNRIV